MREHKFDMMHIGSLSLLRFSGEWMFVSGLTKNYHAPKRTRRFPLYVSASIFVFDSFTDASLQKFDNTYIGYLLPFLVNEFLYRFRTHKKLLCYSHFGGLHIFFVYLQTRARKIISSVFVLTFFVYSCPLNESSRDINRSC